MLAIRVRQTRLLRRAEPPGQVCKDIRRRRAALGRLLIDGVAASRISLETWPGRWENVGTPAQLAALQGDSAPAA